MKRKLNLLLTAINTDMRFPNLPIVPLSIYYLSAFLKKDKRVGGKVSLSIKEFTVVEDPDKIAESILAHKPDLAGFSCYVWNIENTLLVCKKLKEKNENIKIVLGGPQVSPIAYDTLNTYPFIDIIVRDEGEITFTELVKSILKGNDSFENINGITCRSDSCITQNKGRRQLENLNAIPFPYDRKIITGADRSVSIETQRGCVFNCAFCYYQKSFTGIRYFALKRIKRDLAFLLRKRVKNIYLMDPVFNLDRKRAKKICRFIIQNNRHKTSFNTELKAELVDEELAKLMKKANFNRLEVGLQSVDKKVLKTVHRHMNRKEFERGFKLLKKYDVHAELQLIFGLPGDNLKSFMESIDYAVGLAPHKLALFDLCVLPGTFIRENTSKWGLEYEQRPPYRIIRSSTFSDSDVKMFRLAREFILKTYNSWLIKCITKDLDIKISDISLSWADWIMKLENENRPLQKNTLAVFLNEFVARHKNKLDQHFYKTLIGDGDKYT